MERLIESVRKFPCLWKTDIEEYKLNDVKEAAWREVVKECDLPDVKEAKTLWRKLRDGHRQAVSRKKTTTGQAANPKNLWKYEKLMEFLLPTMQNRSRSTNIDTQDSQPDSDVSLRNEDSSESEQHQSFGDLGPPKKKNNLTSFIQNEQKRREIRSAERDSLRRQLLASSTSNDNTSSIVENTALERFFMSMLLTTNSLSETLQLRVQRQVFNIVMEAKEADIATRRSSVSSPVPNIVHHFRGDTPFQISSTPQYDTSPRGSSKLSNYSDVVVTSPPKLNTQCDNIIIEHGQNYSPQYSAEITNSSSQDNIRSYMENESLHYD